MDIKAYAKVNISLDVVGKRSDGYHEMLMVMQRVGMWDDISLAVRDGQGEVTVDTDRRFIPNGEKNIAGKAARAFLDAAGIADKDVAITIRKQIPVCAGLGGGSSDAAAVLEGLNEHFGGPLDEKRLYTLAESLGADVPFCLHGGTALVSGKGETIRELPDFPHSWFVICKPEFSVSTPELFDKLDRCKLVFHPDTAGVIEALETGDLAAICHRCYNVFEDVLPEREGRIISDVKDVFVSNGALCSSMSGTGSAVFGIFAERASAEHAREELRKSYDEVFLAEVGAENAAKSE